MKYQYITCINDKSYESFTIKKGIFSWGSIDSWSSIHHISLIFKCQVPQVSVIIQEYDNFEQIVGKVVGNNLFIDIENFIVKENSSIRIIFNSEEKVLFSIHGKKTFISPELEPFRTCITNDYIQIYIDQLYKIPSDYYVSNICFYGKEPNTRNRMKYSIDYSVNGKLYTYIVNPYRDYNFDKKCYVVSLGILPINTPINAIICNTFTKSSITYDIFKEKEYFG